MSSTAIPVTIATLTATVAQTLKRNQMLSAGGYRVITPKSPQDIHQLLATESIAALIVNDSVSPSLRETLMPEIRRSWPELLIVHVYYRGQPDHESWADANVEITDPARLVLTLEELLRHRTARSNLPQPGQPLSPS